MLEEMEKLLKFDKKSRKDSLIVAFSHLLIAFPKDNQIVCVKIFHSSKLPKQYFETLISFRKIHCF